MYPKNIPDLQKYPKKFQGVKNIMLLKRPKVPC